MTRQAYKYVGLTNRRAYYRDAAWAMIFVKFYGTILFNIYTAETNNTVKQDINYLY